MEHPKLKFHRHTQSGVALVLVLMLVVLTTIMMLAFFLSVQTESKSTRAVVAGQNSQQIADIAVQSVIAQIQKATTQGPTIAWASQPGLIRTYDSTGAAAGWYKLYSSGTNIVANPSESLSNLQADLPTAAYATAGSANYGVYTDLNSPVYSSTGTTTLEYPIMNPIGATSIAKASGTTANAVLGFDIATGSVTGYTAGATAGSNASPTNNPAAMPVRWMYVLADGTMSPGVQSPTPGTVKVANASKSNPIVGRVAYWTDDETCKLNINTAADGGYYDTPRFNSSGPNTSGLAGITPSSTQDSDIILDRQMARSPPVNGEFQRYIGHPAQTQMGFVINSTLASSGILNRSNVMTLLSPFMQWGGSDAGTQLTYTSVTNTLNTPTRQTPYASLDEWMFSNAKLSGVNRVTSQDLSGNTLLTNSLLQRLRFFLSASSDAPEVNLFGQPRVSMWPIYTSNLQSNATPGNPSNYLSAFDQMIANSATLFPSSTTPMVYYFGRQNAASPTIDWAGTAGTVLSTNSTANTRNQNLFALLRTQAATAVPGYGKSFNAKYSAGEMDQILTEIFDCCRSINAEDLLLPGANFYSATGQGSGPPVADGGAQVTPITISAANFGGAYTTKGFGRFDTVDQVSLDFTNGEPTVYNANGTPNPNMVSVTGLIYLSLYSPSMGFPSLNPHLKIVVQSPNSPGQINLNVTGSDGTSYAVFGSPNNGANSARKVFSVVPLPPSSGNYNGYNNGHNGDITWGGVAGARQLLLDKAGTFYNTTVTTGTVTTGTNTPNVGNYELCGINISIPTTCTSLSMAATPLEIKIYHTDAAPTWTTTNGGGDGLDGTAAELVQDITVVLPAFSNLPMPTNSATNDISTRLYDTAYCAQTYSGYGLYIMKGDIVQSIVGGYNGDSRLIAAQQTINDSINTGTLGSAPSPAYVKHPYYGQLNEPSSGLTMAQAQLDIFPFLGQPFFTPPGTGQLVPGVTYPTQGSANQLATTFIPTTGFIDTTLAGKAKLAPEVTGDWDNGWGVFPDGPFINKADEAGAQYSTSASYYFPDPYYNGGLDVSLAGLSTPNRTLASPVMFGSLPTGVPLGIYSGGNYTPYKTVEGPAGQAIPWQTLLFRPQPNHYGSSNGGTTIEDEEILDWFWMPVVEPYAISSTLDTAGKVNLNYQIAPFTYVTRATALTGVLGSEYVISAPTTKGTTYKAGGVAPFPTYRSPVRVIGGDGLTIDYSTGSLGQFNQRFNSGLIFKSAAEICDINLVPNVTPSATTGPFDPTSATAVATYWANNALTGDNSRERPYNGLYSRLTTKSNTFTVHVRAQALKTPKTTPDGQWIEDPHLVQSEYRAAVTVNRYLDPQDPNIPDFTASANLLKYSLDSYYKYRVIETRRFLP